VPKKCCEPLEPDDRVLHTDRAIDPGIFRSQTTPMRQISSLKVMETWLEVMGYDVTLGGITYQSQGLPASRVAPIWGAKTLYRYASLRHKVHLVQAEVVLLHWVAHN
jgi:hypothetical protein